MGTQVVGLLEETAKMFRPRVEMAYDQALVQLQQQLLDKYDKFVSEQREQLLQDIMDARQRIVDSIMVEALGEQSDGAHIRIYMRDDDEQSE
jgi:hypothetical protein